MERHFPGKDAKEGNWIFRPFIFLAFFGIGESDLEF